MRIAVMLFFALLALACPASARSEGHASSQDMNESNNPLTPKLGINVQDQVVINYYALPRLGDINVFDLPLFKAGIGSSSAASTCSSH